MLLAYSNYKWSPISKKVLAGIRNFEKNNSDLADFFQTTEGPGEPSEHLKNTMKRAKQSGDIELAVNIYLFVAEVLFGKKHVGKAKNYIKRRAAKIYQDADMFDKEVAVYQYGAEAILNYAPDRKNFVDGFLKLLKESYLSRNNPLEAAKRIEEVVFLFPEAGVEWQTKWIKDIEYLAKKANYSGLFLPFQVILESFTHPLTTSSISPRTGLVTREKRRSTQIGFTKSRTID